MVLHKAHSVPQSPTPSNTFYPGCIETPVFRMLPGIQPIPAQSKLMGLYSDGDRKYVLLVILPSSHAPYQHPNFKDEDIGASIQSSSDAVAGGL